MKQHLYSLSIEVLRQIVAILLPERVDEFEQVFNKAENEFMQTASAASTEADAQDHAINAYFAVAAAEVVNFVSALSFDEQFKLYHGDITIANLLMADQTFAGLLKAKNYLDGEKITLQEIEATAKERFRTFVQEKTDNFASLTRIEREMLKQIPEVVEKLQELVTMAQGHANTAYTSSQEAANSTRAAKQSATESEGWKKIAEDAAEKAAKFAAKPVFWRRFTVIILLGIFIALYFIGVTISSTDFSGFGKASQDDYETLQKEFNNLQEQVNNLPTQSPITEQPVDNTDTDAGVEQQQQPPPEEQKPVETPLPSDKKDDSNIWG